MFFDHYPYTNFHNVNLDWVLQAVKAWGQTVEANDRAFRDLKEANEDFKEYVTNYLQDLDITDEINTKLDAMLASGVLTPYFAPYVQGYVNSWLNAHVTPTSPALDNTLTLSGAAARADSTGKRLKDLAYIDALSTPEVIASLNRSEVLPGYRVQGITYDYDGHYYVCGGSVDEDGTGVIVKMTKPDFTDAEITVIPQLGHANDIAYYNGYLYVCTVGGGDAPRWGIYKINVNDFTDKTLISNAPENTIGISYRQGDFWLLAPYRIYRTTDFTSYEVVVANTNDLLTAYGIPTEGRISQTIFRAAGYLIGWVCSFVFEERHYGAITFFSSTGQPIAFKMFPAYHSEIQGAVYADMSIYLLADGNMVNVFRMDPRHLSYIQLKAGDDLNDFTGRGTLYSTGSNVSAELLNSPSSGEGFTVQVERLGVYNTIQTARTNSGRELYRVKSFSSGTWGEWIEPAAEVARIKDDLSDLRSVFDWTHLATPTYPLGWRIGYYRASDGTYNTNATGISSAFSVYIPTDNVREFTIKVPDGRGVSVYEYNFDTGYVGRSGSIGTASTPGPSEVTITPNRNCYYKFAVGFFSGGSGNDFLTQEFIDSIVLTEKRHVSTTENKHLNICIFGNSYSADSWAYVPFILRKYGITCNIHIYYRGSGSVDRLVAEWDDNSITGLDDFGRSHVRRYTHIDTRYEYAWENARAGISAKEVLEMVNDNPNFNAWDLIVLNAGSRSQSFTVAPGNGDPRKGAEPYLRQAINLINASYNGRYHLAWFEDYTSFDGYAGDTAMGYPAISPEEMDNRVGVLKSTETIMGAEPFDFVIPAGSAIFNARTNASLASTALSVTGNLWCSDKIHLQAGIPNYIANCAVVQSIFNKFYPHLSILGEDTRITDALITSYACPFITSWCGSVMDSSEQLYELGQKAAFMACKYPFDITPIYLPTDDTALAWFDSHSDRYWADVLITRPSGT